MSYERQNGLHGNQQGNRVGGTWRAGPAPSGHARWSWIVLLDAWLETTLKEMQEKSRGRVVIAGGLT